MIDFLVELINTIGVPVVLIGTPKARSIFEQEFRIIRRASGQGDLIWDRMVNDATWRFFLDFLWRYQYTKLESPLTDEISEALYYETQGIVDLAVKLYLLAQVRAILSGKERVTAAIVKSAARDHLRLAQPVLKALRSGKPAEIARYDDIDALDFGQAFAQETESARSVTVATAGSMQVDEAPKPRAMQATGSPAKPKAAKQAATATAERSPNDLRVIVNGGAAKGKAAYEALLASGCIRPATEFLA
jgi:hypothetical protein